MRQGAVVIMSLAGLVAGSLLLTVADVGAQGNPLRQLQGQIIVSPDSVYVPEDAEGFVEKMQKQHLPRIPADGNGQYKLNYVAFFKPLAIRSLFAVVTDTGGNTLQAGQVATKKGQTSLQSYIIVEEVPRTGSPGVFKLVSVSKGGKEKIHAQAKVTLLPR